MTDSADKASRPAGQSGQPPAARRAIALRHESQAADVPSIVATGKGHLAARIIELARENGVPIREDPVLVQALAGLEVGESIPPDLYRVVAEVFAWLYRIDRIDQASREASSR